MPLSEDLVATISGPDDGLPLAVEANLNADTAWVEVEDATGASVKVNGTLFRTLLGAVAFASTGDVNGTGILGAFTLAIGAGKVTLAKLAALPAKSLIGNNQASSATPRALGFSDDFTFVGDTLHTAAAAAAEDGATEFLYNLYGMA